MQVFSLLSVLFLIGCGTIFLTNLQKEFLQYAEQIKKEVLTGDDVLRWWKSHPEFDVLLGPLARKYLGIPASQTSVERLFSIARWLFSPRRKSMSHRMFEALVLIKNYVAALKLETVEDLEHFLDELRYFLIINTRF